MSEAKFREFVFTIMMVLVMVYFMVLYNAAWKLGVQSYLLTYPLLVMWPEVAAAYMMQRFIAGPLSAGLSRRISAFTGRNNFYIRAFCTVIIMAPCMTLFITLAARGFNADFFSFWGRSLLRNIFFAFCLQVFIAGPAVRSIHGFLFRKAADA